MSTRKILFIAFVVSASLPAAGQDQSALAQEMRDMSKERNPQKSIALMNTIIAGNKLDPVKDAETIDALKGTVALAFLRQRQYDAFHQYIAAMKSKFNQTSFMDMGANILLKDGIDTVMAERLSKATLDLYFSYKDDPAAKPAEMSPSDWKRFMEFAQYPYYDSYADALTANGRYKEALQYQEKAFSGPPEEGLSSSVERYAKLLALNGLEARAYDLLVSVAGKGKSTAGMNAQLKQLYVRRQGSAAGFDEYLAGLQKGVQAELKRSFAAKMLDTVAPDFSLLDLSGRRVSLADYRGKVVVLDFWATWCMPCIASFPAMQRMVKQYPEVAFLFIATQEKPDGALARVRSFIQKKNYSFHVLMDKPLGSQGEQFAALSAYKPNGIPAKYVIDGKGRLRFTSTGFTSDSELINELGAMIDLAKSSIFQ